jgi:hypothetical protein
MLNLDWKNILVNFMSIFNNKGSLRIFNKAFQWMEVLTSSLYDMFRKDESFFHNMVDQLESSCFLFTNRLYFTFVVTVKHFFSCNSHIYVFFVLLPIFTCYIVYYFDQILKWTSSLPKRVLKISIFICRVPWMNLTLF